MKKAALLLTIFSIIFTSCEKDEVTPQQADITGIYILNYGTYGGSEGSLSAYNYATDKLSNNAYSAANKDVKMGGNPQYAYEYKGNIYFMGNDKDEVYYVEKDSLKQSGNGVSKDLVKPRYCVGYEDYLYISCWGGNAWEDASVSYIAVYNITTNKVDRKIALAGGPEGLEIANGKLFCALNYDSKIAIMDLKTDVFTYINDIKAVTSYFLKDKKDNLYVSMTGSFSVTTTKSGIGYINTTTNTLEVYELDNVSQGYASVMAANSDFSKIYVLATTYDDNYKLSGAVKTFDIKNRAFDETPFLSNIKGLKGISVNPKSNELFVLTSADASSNGELLIYDNKGTKKGNYKTGIEPAWVLFVK